MIGTAASYVLEAVLPARLAKVGRCDGPWFRRQAGRMAPVAESRVRNRAGLSRLRTR